MASQAVNNFQRSSEARRRGSRWIAWASSAPGVICLPQQLLTPGSPSLSGCGRQTVAEPKRHEGERSRLVPMRVRSLENRDFGARVEAGRVGGTHRKGSARGGG